jgi:hypothetical protein
MSDYGTPPPNQPPPNQPTGGYGGPVPSGQPRKGFFGALFDFGFEHFITPIIVKIVYVLALVGLVLGWLVFLVAGFSQDTGYGITVLFLGPFGIILYLAFIRMTLEFYLAIVRMSQDIHERLR